MVHVINLFLIILIYFQLKRIAIIKKNKVYQRKISLMIEDLSLRIDKGNFNIDEVKEELDFLEKLSNKKLV